MKYYQDITLLPDPETDLYFLWQKVYQQMHLALVEQKDDQGQVRIGFSFPNYQYSKAMKHLGSKLRVFANSKLELEKLGIDKWLGRLTDYVHVTQIREVPEGVEEYVCFSRKQVKANPEALARRRSKRKNEPIEKAIQHYDGFQPKNICLPFVRLKSLSSQNEIKIYIEKKVQREPKEGVYGTYGLSSVTTVPWF